MDLDEAKRALIRSLESVAGPEVVSAITEVPREEFVPGNMRSFAYEDCALSLGYGSTISQPTMVAIVLEDLQLSAGMNVYEAGSGSGYLLALLEKLGCNAYGAEIVEPLCKQSVVTLRRLGFAAQLHCGDAAKPPWPILFHRVVFSAAVKEVPTWSIDILTEEGFVVAPLEVNGAQEIVRVTREGMERTGHLCRFVPFQSSLGG